ncbi:MAG: PAS domain S-box protein [Thermodesulfobacteriota bacterium]|nr:PAS domain S-box protein [Thermodesulfobacteriota bacterium]
MKKRDEMDIRANGYLRGDRARVILKSAVENTNEGFVTIDSNHKVIFFNKAAEEIFGYRRDEVIGRDLDVIMVPSCSKDHRQAVERYIRTREPRRIGHDTEITATKRNGEIFPAFISFSVSEVDGELYFTGIVRDLTETKALQERIAKAERLSALGQVVAEITHEIKNPLMMIGGFAHQLARGNKDKDDVKKLNIIMDETKRLESLIKELKELYLPKSLNVEKIEVNELLRDVCSLIQDDCREKNIHIKLETEVDSLIIEGDSNKIKQVLLNLTKNSIEAIEDGGNLLVSSRKNGGIAEIVIDDDGCGIPLEIKEKIFNPFFTTKSHGTGLGLSISRSIVEDHEGGSFTLSSEEGCGATFRIGFPLSPMPEH